MYIEKFHLENQLIVSINYDYETRSIHVCENSGYETTGLIKKVIEHKDIIKSSLHVMGKVNYYVTYSNSGIDVNNENGKILDNKVHYIPKYERYYLDRAKRLLTKYRDY